MGWGWELGAKAEAQSTATGLSQGSLAEACARRDFMSTHAELDSSGDSRHRMGHHRAHFGSLCPLVFGQSPFVKRPTNCTLLFLHAHHRLGDPISQTES